MGCAQWEGVHGKVGVRRGGYGWGVDYYRFSSWFAVLCHIHGPECNDGVKNRREAEVFDVVISRGACM